jgi:hypothetical protein
MLTRMSDSPNGDPRAPASAGGPSVLAGLPRTRPQRVSARRAASRAAKPSTAPPRHTKERQPAPSRVTGLVIGEPVPRQGFEAEPDSLAGPVQPPGGTELVASAAELAGELAKAGVATGARMLKDFLSRLPG